MSLVEKCKWELESVRQSNMLQKKKKKRRENEMLDVSVKIENPDFNLYT